MFLKFYFIALLVNIGFFIMGGYADDLGETNVSGNLTSSLPDLPDSFNSTDNSGTLVNNMTNPTNQTLSGHTGDDGILDIFEDSTEVILINPYVLINFFDMGFIINTLSNVFTSIGVVIPPEVTTGLYVAGGLSFAIFILYLVTGKSPSSFV